MKGKGIVYSLSGGPRFRGSIRMAAGWVHVLEGGEQCIGYSQRDGDLLQNYTWEPLAHAVSIEARQVARIEWMPRDRQIAGQTRMAIGGSE